MIFSNATSFKHFRYSKNVLAQVKSGTVTYRTLFCLNLKNYLFLGSFRMDKHNSFKSLVRYYPNGENQILM